MSEMEIIEIKQDFTNKENNTKNSKRNSDKIPTVKQEFDGVQQMGRQNAQ